jgi:hypothetical protein
VYIMMYLGPGIKIRLAHQLLRKQGVMTVRMDPHITSNISKP